MAEQLDSGTYKPSDEIEVIYWKAPDPDGDGEEVWEDRRDNNGNSLGRHTVKDNNGKVLRHYSPPDGFVNHPSYDFTDNYVLGDNRGRIHRDIDGNAISIRPGTALVLYPNGKSEVLEDEYARHLFAKAHQKVADEVDLTDTNDDDDEDQADDPDPTPAPVKSTPAKATPAKATPATVQGGHK